MPPLHDHHQTSLFATSAAGCCWWLVDQLVQHGPSWQLIPPLLIGSASLLGAVRSTLDGAQARRHAEERHRAALATEARA
jgi:hypothetical protein